MSEAVTPERVACIAAAARVSLDPGSAARVANSTAAAAKRFAEENVSYPFETEPATFVVVARKDFER